MPLRCHVLGSPEARGEDCLTQGKRARLTTPPRAVATPHLWLDIGSQDKASGTLKFRVNTGLGYAIHMHQCVALSGPAIRKPTFRRFARIDSQKKTSIFEALGQIRANRVFPPIRVQLRVIRIQFSLEGRFAKRICFRSENRFRIDSRESAH